MAQSEDAMNRLRFKTHVLPILWIFLMTSVVVAGYFDLRSPQGAPVAVSRNDAAPRDMQPVSNPRGAGEAPPSPSAATPSLTPELQRGQVLFARQCALCHGDAGDGAGRFAYLMNPRPRNFQKGKFKLVTTDNRVPNDEDILRVITRGMPGSAMPPWGHLPEADLKALVAWVKYIRDAAVTIELAAGLEDGTYQEAEASTVFAERTTPGTPIVIPSEAPFDDLRWFNGRRIYLEACASCHGIDGHPVAEAVKFDDEGFPTPPRSFVNGIFKGGMDGPSLYARIVLGIPGTPMPAYEDTYTPADMWDLIHYVQSLARAGSQDRAQLRQGSFTASRVESLPAGPTDEAWNRAKPLYVAMMPLWWLDERVEGVVVQSLHDGNEIAFRLSWLDQTRDERAVRVDEFRDAVAIQFALAPDPPFYMGDRNNHGGVNIWMWKADRQKNIASGYQDVDAAFPDGVADMYAECPVRSPDMSVVDWPHGNVAEHNPTYITAWGADNLVADPTLKTPVECLTARGPGTLAGKPPMMQLVQGSAAYARGVWSVQLQRTLALPCDHGSVQNGDAERAFKSGDYLPVSFAIWDGSAGDRDGKKSISIWQKMVIE